jgi:hypothetical protein
MLIRRSSREDSGSQSLQRQALLSSQSLQFEREQLALQREQLEFEKEKFAFQKEKEEFERAKQMRN